LSSPEIQFSVGVKEFLGCCISETAFAYIEDVVSLSVYLVEFLEK
jgi:hypothetical protein